MRSNRSSGVKPAATVHLRAQVLVGGFAILLAQQHAHYAVLYRAACDLGGGRRHIGPIDDKGVDRALEAVVEVGVVEQEAFEGLPPVLSLELEMEQTAVTELEDRIELFQVNVGDG
jgi:hypothetical protein